MIFDHDRIARDCLRPIRGCATDEQWRDVVAQVRDALQESFDLGFKAAGGEITPTNSSGDRGGK
jgi:hypothetical protein